MDDTILDDSATVEACWDRTCAEFAGPAGVEVAAFRAAVQAEKDWFWSDGERHRAGRLDLDAARTSILAGALRRLGKEGNGVAAEAARAYARCRPFPGALEALAAFRERGVRLALITNGASAVQREKIGRFGLEPHFDGIFIEGEMGFGKPDERVFHRALAAVGAEPRDAWVVGDNLEWEIVPAKRLGMGAVWVDPAGRGLEIPRDRSEARPDRVVRCIRELLD
jgi:putative hydrolase of the HAD superfamily